MISNEHNLLIKETIIAHMMQILFSCNWKFASVITRFFLYSVIIFKQSFMNNMIYYIERFNHIKERNFLSRRVKSDVAIIQKSKRQIFFGFQSSP